MNPQKTYTVDEAQRRLERYCAYQERCHLDVQKKLNEMRMIPEAKDKIIVHLLHHDFLNEERFAKAYVRGKFRIKKWGKQRLTLELKRRDIGKTIIASALKEIDHNDYLETFDALARKKVSTLRESNLQKKRKKLADYLLYRGWESSMVYDKVRELIP
ncbi:regulatory protein RecX [Psychroserpens sp. XS_ASV72]|uniref:regulatory protein RecX n=1 Tax=Psychroserpens sp. XS_ASV72 TaxID=3241293 RepID=UPI0035119E5F